MISSEAAPLAKTGGLADVVGVLESYNRLPEIAARTGYPYYNVGLQILSKYPILEPSDAEGLYSYLEVSPGEAVAMINRLAPEHAGLALENAAEAARGVSNAGAVFVGHHASEAIGDYFAGPSHVLPTGGSARFASPLGVGDFLKRTSFIEYDAAAVTRQAADIVALAEVEGLSGHGRSVSLRNPAGKSSPGNA